MRRRTNDPVLDARLALEVFGEQREALGKADPDLLTAWHWLTTPEPCGVDRAVDRLFAALRGAPRPAEDEVHSAIRRLLDGRACATHTREVCRDAASAGWALGYALAWLSVDQELDAARTRESVMPPWVLHNLPKAPQLLRRLRDTACADSACGWCRAHHDARREMKRWFGFKDFRPEPADSDGHPMQQSIVEEAMAGGHALGILPTGTGKSLCYQLPAISRYDKTGALTVVISPLVALMADQVAGLEAQGIECCVTVNGMLSMPERAAALERIRLGGAGILLIAPEQLRSRSLRRALDQREIGGWVVDEAHCLSSWGHDFRPDYRYVSRFIREREKARSEPTPPLLCLTATATPQVRDDIVHHFEEKLRIDLAVFDGGAKRRNLSYEVIDVTGGEKLARIHQVLESHLSHAAGGAIGYCATRRTSEKVAKFLREKGAAAEHFHAGLLPGSKKDVQKRFVNGDLRVIAATNAFGMGIDKPDVRLVVHADVPGSLENYFQEAGRAGRDGKPASCVLLYAPQDVERQFSLSAYARLTRQEIHGVLRALRNLDRRKRYQGEVVATAGEILDEDEDNLVVRDSATDDTRVRTAIAWLEEARLLRREENVVNVFPSSLRVESVEQARRRLERPQIATTYRDKLLRIVKALITSSRDETISTDELMTLTGLHTRGVLKALYDLELLGIVSNDTEITAFVHADVKRSSLKRLEQAAALEIAVTAHMREAAPDQEKGDAAPLNLRIASQRLRDQGLADPLPERLLRILRAIAGDGRAEDDAAGSLSVRKLSKQTAWITLQRDWSALETTAALRRQAAGTLLEHLLGRLPKGSQGEDLLAETTLGKLLLVIKQSISWDNATKRKFNSPNKLLDHALMWLHELEIIRLNKGLAVFRPAMTVRLARGERRGFTNGDFEPLALHYEGRDQQVHVMAAFAELGLEDMREALAVRGESRSWRDPADVVGSSDGHGQEESSWGSGASLGVGFGSAEKLRTPVLRALERHPRVGRFRRVRRIRMCGVLRGADRSSESASRRVLPVVVPGLLRGPGFGARDRVACLGFPEHSSVPGPGRDGSGAGSFDDFAHSSAHRRGDSRQGVRVGSRASGGLGSGVGQDGGRGCDDAGGECRPAQHRASRHGRGLRGVRPGSGGGLGRGDADAGGACPFRPQAEEEAVERGVGESS